MDLGSIVRRGVALAHQITNDGGLQDTVTLERWAGDDDYGAPAYLTIGTSSVANPTLITTTTAHGLATGDVVVITGHAGSTPSLNAQALAVIVLSPTTFSVPVAVTVGGAGGTVAVRLPALVEWQQKTVRSLAGAEVTSRAIVHFFYDVLIDEKDRLTLSDGETAPIIDIGGLVDPTTSRGYTQSVYI